MAVRRFPSKTEPSRLNRYLWESTKGFCYSSLRNKRDKDKCTLQVGTSSFESFSETLLKGRVNIGPYTFKVEVPKNNTIWCWTGGREGHFRKICTAQARKINIRFNYVYVSTLRYANLVNIKQLTVFSMK